MSTLVPPALNRIYDLIAPHLSSDKRGGIANANSPGYHTSRADLIRQGRPSDYSIQAPADKRGNANYASGIDITLSDAEMKLVTNRLRKACTPVNGDYDPRIECIREFIGTTDGRNVQGYNRYATGSGSRSTVGWKSSGFSDSSHLWHVHISVFRDYCDDDNKMRGLAEVIAGVTPGTFGWKGASSGDVEQPPAPVETPKPAEPTKPKYLPTRYVDPKKVDSTLTANAPEGKEDKYREPGFAITTGVQLDGKWLVTEAGYRYHTDYLTTTKPVIVPKPDPKPEPKAVRRTFVNSNMMRDDDDRVKFSSRANGLAAFYVNLGASVFTWQEVDPHISDESPLMTVVTKMGAKYRYDRGGPNAVGWNSEIWDADLENAFTKKLVHIDGYGQRYLHVVPLVDKETGKKVWVASVHLNHKTGSEANGLRAKQAKEVAGYLKPYIAKGDRVLLAGDLNDAGTTSGEPKGILKAAGFSLLSDQSSVKNRKVESHHGLSKSKPTNDGRWIDEVFWAGMKFVSGSLVDTWAKKLSDHNALQVTLEL